MKILVTGDRTWVDQASIQAELKALKGRHPEGPWVLVHGGATGVDNIAGYVGRLLGYEVRAYTVTPQEWDMIGPVAGILRNQKMLDLEHPDGDGDHIDYALAFHHDPKLGKGTKDMVTRIATADPAIPLEVIVKPRRKS